MTIRLIETKDNEALKKIIQSSLASFGLDIPGTAYFDPELGRLSDYYAASEGRRYFVLVNEKDQAIGGVGVAEYQLPGAAELQKLYLSEEARGQGASYQLMDQALLFAREAGYETIYLETHHLLVGAIQLYEKLGFEEIPQPSVVQHTTMDRFYRKGL